MTDKSVLEVVQQVVYSTFWIFLGIIASSVLFYLFLIGTRLVSRARVTPQQGILYTALALAVSLGGAGLAEIGGGPVAVILSAILGGLIPGFFVFLRVHLGRIHDAISKISNISTAIDIDKSFSVEVRAVLSRVLSYLSSKSAELNTIPSSSGYSTDVLLDMMSRKMMSAIDQALKREVYIRREEFDFVWKNLTAQSESYISVCDLSAYSGISGPALVADRVEWKSRVGREINHLSGVSILKNFDKIILYETRTVEGQPKAAMGTPCATGNGLCDPRICEVECLVKDVATSWVDGSTSLPGKASHITGAKSIVALCRKSKFGVLDAINISYYSNPIRSSDIGIFGDGFLGEELKLRREMISSTSGRKNLNRDHQETFDYLYVISKNNSKTSNLRDIIIGKLTSEVVLPWT